MIQFILLAILSSIFFGFLAVTAVRRLRKTEEELRHKNIELERHFYELSISQEIANQIGYSLNIQSIIGSIVGTAERLLAQSAIAYALVEDKTITLKIIQNDYVGPHFLEHVKKLTLDTVFKGMPKDGHHVIETTEKKRTETHYYDDDPQSVLSVPLLVNGKFTGAITVVSSAKNAFSDEDVKLFQRIVENTTSAVSKLEQVITTEKAKLDSFLFSLTSGALLFLVDSEVLRLSAINSAAKEFLHVTGAADTTMVIARFGMHYDLVQDIKDALTEKKSMIIKDIKIYERYFKIYLNPVFLSDMETVIGVSVTMEDVTYEKDIEQMRETFTSVIVHELRAPLTSIKGASAMLLSGKLRAPDSQKMLQIIHDSTERMLTDISDILDVSKIEAGKFTLNIAPADMNKLIADKILAFSFTAAERKIQLTIQPDSTIQPVLFDSQRLGQVLNNLISNALKFTPDNGAVVIATSHDNEKITVSVKDTGVGVASEKIPLLFSKYGQLQSSIRKEGGTGLGLFISKGIVESHGGKIWLESKQGMGTTVTFTLPIVTKIDSSKIGGSSVPSHSASAIPSSIPSSKVIPARIVN